MLELRPYQKTGVQYLKAHPKCLLADEMGLGKTVTTLMALKDERHILVICPKFALYVWQDEIVKWLGEPATIYTGTPKQRAEIIAKHVKSGNRFLITNYAFLAELSGRIAWGAIVADEIHMAGLLNHKSVTFKAFKKLSARVPKVILVTGTPVRQGMKDLFAPLNIIDPSKFRAYWPYLYTHGIVLQGPFGKAPERKPKNTLAFRRMLKRYMLRRLKREVDSELPEKTRQIIRCTMTPEQQKMYMDLEENMYTLQDDAFVIVPNAVSLITRLRQLLVSPMLLGAHYWGGALETFKTMVTPLLEDNEPVVVFSPYRDALDHIRNMIHDIDKTIPCYKVKGGMTPEALRDQIEGFKKHEKSAAVFLGTIASGASYTITNAATCFFVGCEWDANKNTQAEDRLHRIGQTRNVICYYLLYEGALADDRVRELLNSKQDAQDWIISPDWAFKEILAKREKRRLKEI